VLETLNKVKWLERSGERRAGARPDCHPHDLPRRATKLFRSRTERCIIPTLPSGLRPRSSQPNKREPGCRLSSHYPNHVGTPCDLI
jgi:hypothetical protein